MSSLHGRGFLLKHLAWYFLLLNGTPVSALPAPQEVTASPTPEGPTPVTSLATSNGQVITEVFTPTSISISGLTPPITKATVVTTTDEAGATVAVAIAAGAGVVGAGAIAAWLFEPVPGAPPAPTEPPSYSTSEQEDPDTVTDDDVITTSEQAAACPFTSIDAAALFTSMPDPPKWTIEIPTLSVSSIAPECTKQGNNDQLLRAAEPAYIQELSEIFCKTDLSKDQTQTLGQSDLPDGSVYKEYDYGDINYQFGFDFEMKDDGCPSNCVDAYSTLVSACRYSSHYLYGDASLKQGCGTYSFKIDAEPLTKLTCSDQSALNTDIIYRDAAVEAIDQFCYAQNGKVLKQGDEGSYIQETTISAVYADDCTGDGEYTISEDTCKKYLTMALDECDTDTTIYKHGGTVVSDTCGSFTLHPKGYERVACYPDNEKSGYITGGTHVQVTPAMAEDAINKFCDRDGDGQQYTIDPDVPPSGGFVQDSCTSEGEAYCGYFYYNDGTNADGDGEIFIRMSAAFVGPSDDWSCATQQKYEIHGDRCKDNLRKVIGVEPSGQCVGSDPNQLDLGSVFESGEKGCVLWNMWAVATH
ncbi:hypothetical protein FQN54_006352 [Arachnomyces sp. PD_36]|nr:hypothetical protein FQN54_006352 [Arachnomyces sp. PD_36]